MRLKNQYFTTPCLGSDEVASTRSVNLEQLRAASFFTTENTENPKAPRTTKCSAKPSGSSCSL